MINQSIPIRPIKRATYAVYIRDDLIRSHITTMDKAYYWITIMRKYTNDRLLIVKYNNIDTTRRGPNSYVLSSKNNILATFESLPQAKRMKENMTDEGAYTTYIGEVVLYVRELKPNGESKRI